MLTCHLKLTMKHKEDFHLNVQVIFEAIPQDLEEAEYILRHFYPRHLSLVVILHSNLNVSGYVDWSKFDTELLLLKVNSWKISSLKILKNQYFTGFMDNKDIVTETVVKVAIKPLVLFLPYIGSISSQAIPL